MKHWREGNGFPALLSLIPGGDSSGLVLAGLGSVGLKVVSLILNLSLSVVLARLLAPEGYGTYAAVLALVALLGVPADLGFQSLLIREIASYEATEQWGRLRGLVRYTFSATTLISLLLIGSVVLFRTVSSRGWDSPYGQSLIIGLAALPLVTLGGLRGAALRGLRRVIAGQLPEFALLPGATLGLVGIAVAVGWDLEPQSAMGLRFIAGSAAFVVGGVMLVRALPEEYGKAEPSYESSRWLRSALPLAIAKAVAVLQAQIGIVALSALRPAEEAGLYAVAGQGALLVTFALTAIGLVLMPHVSRLWTNGETVALQSMIRVASRVMLLAALPVALVFVAFGGAVLAYVFGEEFRGAYPLLVILSLAQLFHAATGVSGLMLSMTGFEREYATASGLLTLLSVVATFLLVPIYGAVGAAAAAAGYLITLKVVSGFMVMKYTGVDTSVFAIARRDRG